MKKIRKENIFEIVILNKLYFVANGIFLLVKNKYQKFKLYRINLHVKKCVVVYMYITVYT